MSNFSANPFSVDIGKVFSEQFAIPDDGTIVDLFSVPNERFKWVQLYCQFDTANNMSGGDVLKIVVMNGITPVANWPILQFDPNSKAPIITPIFLPLTSVMVSGGKRLTAVFQGANIGNVHSIFRIAGIP
jgi:hypothetical protein